MGLCYLNIPKPLTTPHHHRQVTVVPPPHEPNYLSMRDYIFEGVAAGIIILALGRLIILRCCIIPCQRRLDLEEARSRQNLTDTMSPPPSRGGSAICLVSSFRYRNGEEGNKTQLDSDTECSICLSVFEEGEEMRKLPMCDHCFHAYCIDRWLFSHTDCPLCRAPVVKPPPPG